MTAPAAESISGRPYPRYQGEPIPHELDYRPANNPAYRDGGLKVNCTCGCHYTIDATADRAEFRRQHLGQEP